MCGWLTDRLLNVLEVFDFPIETREERFFRVASLLEPRWYSPSAKLLFRASLTSRDSLFQIHQKPGLADYKWRNRTHADRISAFFNFFIFHLQRYQKASMNSCHLIHHGATLAGQYFSAVPNGSCLFHSTLL